MKISLVPRGQIMERIAPDVRPESISGKEPPMATKQKPSSGASREHRQSQESEREHAKPAKTRSRSQDSDEAHHNTSHSARGQADDKREQASDREHHEDNTRAHAEQSE